MTSSHCAKPGEVTWSPQPGSNVPYLQGSFLGRKEDKGSNSEYLHLTGAWDNDNLKLLKQAKSCYLSIPAQFQK